MHAAPLVYVVILNYQHSDDTLTCLSSLARSTYANAMVVVVDNGSDEANLATLRRGLDPAFRLIENPQNVGYAAGNNVGIAAALDAGADFVWILNPDTTVEPDALEWLVRAARGDASFGLVGSRVLFGGSRPLQIWYNGATLDLTGTGTVEHQSMGRLDADIPVTGPFRTGYVTGTSMLIRADVLRSVGYLPEDYFLYFEETDYNVRVRRQGWETIVEPRSRIHHFKRSTGWLPTAEYMYYYTRNRLVFGQRFTAATATDIIADLDEFLSTWRMRVAERAPEWLDSFDSLVERALDDGRALRTGPADLTHLRRTSQ